MDDSNKKVLRSAFRGYDKATVLTRVDTLEAMCLAVKTGAMPAEAAAAEADHLLRQPIRKGFGGFVEEDVDSYLSMLHGTIQSLQEEQRQA